MYFPRALQYYHAHTFHTADLYWTVKVESKAENLGAVQSQLAMIREQMEAEEDD